MSESNKKNIKVIIRRKLPVTISFFIGFLFHMVFISINLVVISLVMFKMIDSSALAEFYKEVGVLYRPFQIVKNLLALFGLMGFFNMQKWGVIVYISSFIAGVSGDLYFTTFDIKGYIIPAIIVIIGIIYYKIMGKDSIVYVENKKSGTNK